MSRRRDLVVHSDEGTPHHDWPIAKNAHVKTDVIASVAVRQAQKQHAVLFLLKPAPRSTIFYLNYGERRKGSCGGGPRFTKSRSR